MNPAPPVTSNLRNCNLSENTAQVSAPVAGTHAYGRDRRSLVQHTEMRSPRRSRILVGGDWHHIDPIRKKVQRRPFFCYSDSEVIPARDTSVGPVVDAPECRALRETPEHLRD